MVAKGQIREQEDAKDVAWESELMGGQLSVNDWNTNTETIVQLDLDSEGRQVAEGGRDNIDFVNINLVQVD